MNDNNEAKKVKTITYGWIPKALICCAIVSIIGIVLFHAGAIYHIVSSDNFAENKIESTLLSSGLSIIGIALATWAGLNISNAINASQLAELKKESQYLQEETGKLKAQIEKTQCNTEELERKNKSMIEDLEKESKSIFHRMFLNEITHVQRDLPLQDLMPYFENSAKDPFGRLIKVELMYSQCSIRHRSEYLSDAVLIGIAENGIGEIEQIIKEEKDISEAARCYLDYRKFGFYFYMGYCDETPEKCIANFEKVVACGDKLKSSFYRLRMGGISDSKYYLLNMIGEAQSKIVHYSLNKNTRREENDEREIELKKKADKAVKTCEEACRVSPTTDKLLRSIYCRDYGCSLERREQLTKKDEHKAIIEAYEEALHLIINDVSGNIAARRNAYYVLLSYYKKYIDRILGYPSPSAEDRNEKINIKGSIKKLKSNVDTFNKLKEIVEKMEHISVVARFDFPNRSSMHAYYGYSCAYQSVFALVNGEKKDAAEYVSKVKSVIEDMELLGVKDDFWRQLNEMSTKLMKLVEEETDEDDLSI